EVVAKHLLRRRQRREALDVLLGADELTATGAVLAASLVPDRDTALKTRLLERHSGSSVQATLELAAYQRRMGEHEPALATLRRGAARFAVCVPPLAEALVHAGRTPEAEELLRDNLLTEEHVPAALTR